jgi:hypothetical protein
LQSSKFKGYDERDGSSNAWIATGDVHQWITYILSAIEA